VLVAGLKDVGSTFVEEHVKDALFELEGIHPAAENVGRREEVIFELGKG